MFSQTLAHGGRRCSASDRSFLSRTWVIKERSATRRSSTAASRRFVLCSCLWWRSCPENVPRSWTNPAVRGGRRTLLSEQTLVQADGVGADGAALDCPAGKRELLQRAVAAAIRAQLSAPWLPSNLRLPLQQEAQVSSQDLRSEEGLKKLLSQAEQQALRLCSWMRCFLHPPCAAS